jgi:hypothetical protein
MDNLRETLIDTILNHSGDEFESNEDYVQLAKCTNEQLTYRVIAILNWFGDKYNEN